MKDLLKKYLNILRIELKDLEEDLAVILEVNKKRKEKGEITNYVFLENTAVLKHEISVIRDFFDSVNAFDTSKCCSLQDMIKEIDDLFVRRTRDYDFPQSVYTLVNRKLNKVARYLEESEA